MDDDHRFRGDVEAWLVAPSGRRYQVLKQSNDPGTRIQDNFSLDLSKEWAGGTWSLQFSDKIYLDTGEVRSWYLDLG